MCGGFLKSCDCWGEDHGKMDPIRAPIDNHSILCPPCCVCFLILNTSQPQRHCHIYHKNQTSPNDLCPSAPFTPRWEFRQMSTEVTDNIHSSVMSHILALCALRKTFSLRDFLFSISLKILVLTCLHLFLG